MPIYYHTNLGGVNWLVEDATSEHYTSGTYSDTNPVPTSAEWIDERPFCPSGKVAELAYYYETNWSGASFVYWGEGTVEPLGIDPIIYQITMKSGSTTLAVADLLHSDGETFVTQWKNYGSGAC
jgi:hypothetical protein